jgi:hypothetical protein
MNDVIFNKKKEVLARVTGCHFLISFQNMYL